MAVLCGISLITAALFLCVFPVPGSSYCRNRTYEERHYTFCSGDEKKSEAEVECKKLGMQLAVITTQAEYNHWQAYLILHTFFLGKVWVGATFSQDHNEFLWDNVNISVPHTFFPSQNYSGIPHGACLRFNRIARLEWAYCNTSVDTGHFCQEILETTQATTTLEIQATTAEVVTEGTSVIHVTDTESTTTEITTVTAALSTTDRNLQTDNDRHTTGSLTTELSNSVQTVRTGSEQYVCYCSCLAPEIPSDQAELEVYKQESKEKIERHLYVDTTTLSSTVRRKSSAEDERPSAQSVGYLGVMLMALTFSFIFALDISNVWTCGHSMCNNRKKAKLT